MWIGNCLRGFWEGRKGAVEFRKKYVGDTLAEPGSGASDQSQNPHVQNRHMGHPMPLLATILPRSFDCESRGRRLFAPFEAQGRQDDNVGVRLPLTIVVTVLAMGFS